MWLRYTSLEHKTINSQASRFYKKVKGIVYSDKSTVSFLPPDLKSRSPNRLKPRQQNAVYSDLSTKFSTNPASTKKRTIKNLFWVLPTDTPFSCLAKYHLDIDCC
jgi:hypothetical protein